MQYRAGIADKNDTSCPAAVPRLANIWQKYDMLPVRQLGNSPDNQTAVPAATDFCTIMKMVLGKRDANLIIEQGRGSCEREPHPDGTNYHPYQTLIHTQLLLPTISQTLSCENTYSPAFGFLTYAEQRRHETAYRNFFPGLRPSSRTHCAYGTTFSKKVLPAVLHFVAAPCSIKWGSCRRCPAWPVTRQQGDRRPRNKQMETVKWHKQLDM